ncbi:acetyltransferase [Butyricimonas virosa]|mgnify:CR=1 FL=1|uniref:acetyltransferase n=1 Tax=Butyricimonas virosa TaxID=544645 RepID=UPI003CFFE7BE
MKHLIIIGGGGMGRSVYSMAEDSIGFGTEFDIKGFLDDNLNSMYGFQDYKPVIGTIEGYSIEEDDVFVCSIGDVATKHRICESLRNRGAQFYTIIGKTATVRKNAQIGDGCIIGNYTTIGTDATLGCNCLIQSFASVGHDCVLGDYVRMDTRSMCVGGVIIKDRVSIFTNAVISHNVVVGEDAHVAALSFVIRKVQPGVTVFGNPAKKL